MNVLITGGLGFIGQRIVRILASEGHAVRVLDNLHPQIHRDDSAKERAAQAGADVIVGDINDESLLRRSLEGIDHVIHLAAETGTGQSMSEIARYCETNVTGTARLCEAMISNGNVERVFLASSRAIYGEGAYRCSAHGSIVPRRRTMEDLRSGSFALTCPMCGERATSIATGEETVPNPASVYASTKLMQEYLLQQIGEAKGIDVRIGRYQNVYGPGQSLHNPYTGVLTIFGRQLFEGKRLDVYEDGNIVRDFVYIDDVVDASLAIFLGPNPGSAINVGTGTPATIIDVVTAMADALGREPTYDITGHFRFGDIRSAVADVGRLRALGYARAFTDLRSGIGELVRWMSESFEA